MADEKATQAGKADELARYLVKARSDRKLSLRAVEEATGGEVSNAYLSQLENGKITKPSPHILYALSTALGVPYDALMERAGYIVPSKQDRVGGKHGRAATFAIENLTADEEAELLDYLNYLRQKKS